VLLLLYHFLGILSFSSFVEHCIQPRGRIKLLSPGSWGKSGTKQGKVPLPDSEVPKNTNDIPYPVLFPSPWSPKQNRITESGPDKQLY
jgi:hypothetical protein